MSRTVPIENTSPSMAMSRRERTVRVGSGESSDARRLEEEEMASMAQRER